MSKGRSELGWKDVINKGKKDLELKIEDTTDRDLWRRKTHRADPEQSGKTFKK